MPAALYTMRDCTLVYNPSAERDCTVHDAGVDWMSELKLEDGEKMTRLWMSWIIYVLEIRNDIPGYGYYGPSVDKASPSCVLISQEP
jgi:hypothetical protein